MKTYYFLTLTNSAPDLNPGSHLISDGVKALVRLADPHAILQDITMFEYNAGHWEAMLERCDGIFLCGNPRFNPCDIPVFWLTDLLEFICKAGARGVKTGDLFLGTACPLPVKSASVTASELLFQSWNKTTLKYLSEFDLLITRDSISQEICSGAANGSFSFYDSTFWAKDYYGIIPGLSLYNCVTLPSLNCQPALLKVLYEISVHLSALKQTYILCHSVNEYWLFKKQFPGVDNVILIYDPRSLLEFYSHVDKLVSCRLHGSIPALSLGVKVFNVAMDSRADAYDLFGFRSVSYTSLIKIRLPLTFCLLPAHLHPSPTPFILEFKKKIMEV